MNGDIDGLSDYSNNVATTPISDNRNSNFIYWLFTYQLI